MRDFTILVAELLDSVLLEREDLLAASPRKLASTLEQIQGVSTSVAALLRCEAGAMDDRPVWIMDDGWDVRPIVVQSAVHYVASFAEDFVKSADVGLVVGDLRRGTFSGAHRSVLSAIEADARMLHEDLRRDFASEWWQHDDPAYYERLEDLDVACETYLDYMYRDLNEFTSALDTLRKTGRLSEKSVHWTDRPRTKTIGWVLMLVAVACAVASVPVLAARCSSGRQETAPAARPPSTDETQANGEIPAPQSTSPAASSGATGPSTSPTAAGQGR